MKDDHGKPIRNCYYYKCYKHLKKYIIQWVFNLKIHTTQWNNFVLKNIKYLIIFLHNVWNKFIYV